VSLRMQVQAFHLPLRAPLGTAHGETMAVQGLRLLLQDAEGGFGLGEVTALPSFGTETQAQAAEALASFRLGPPPRSLEEVSACVASLGQRPAAQAGVEVALLDWLARKRGLALARLLGAPGVQAVPVNALLRAETATEVALEAAAAVAAGFGTLKLKVGALPPEVDVARCKAVREAVGPRTRLRIDANGAWTEAEARLRLAPLAPLGLEYVEQPVAAEDIAGLRRLRRLVAVAADEALGLPGAAGALLDGEEGPAADVLILKLAVLGGVLPALGLAARARARGVGAVVTSALDGSVARAAAGHLALALGGPLAHGLSTGALLLEDPGGYPLQAGRLVLRDVPGLGISPEALGW
jgi:o-succinylbenzoate synthase